MSIQQRLNEVSSPWMLLAFLAGYVLGALLLFNIIGMALTMIIFNLNIDETFNLLSNPISNPQAKNPLLLIQGVTAVGAFILVPWLMVRQFNLGDLSQFFRLRSPFTYTIGIVVLTMFSFMVVNSIVIQWNMGISLPENFSWFENWARRKEDELGLLTEYLTAFDSLGQFLMAFVIIAIIPAIGEELLFRGLVQNFFVKALKNPHIAIWVTGFLFAAFHAQFYGLVPRMLLGVLFGYLYFWSGSLGYAMIAHFVNNGFMLIMVYVKDLGMINYDIESQNNVPEPMVIVLFFLITSGLLMFFYRYFNPKQHGGMAEGL